MHSCQSAGDICKEKCPTASSGVEKRLWFLSIFFTYGGKKVVIRCQVSTLWRMTHRIDVLSAQNVVASVVDVWDSVLIGWFSRFVERQLASQWLWIYCSGLFKIRKNRQPIQFQGSTSKSVIQHRHDAIDLSPIGRGHAFKWTAISMIFPTFSWQDIHNYNQQNTRLLCTSTVLTCTGSN